MADTDTERRYLALRQFLGPTEAEHFARYDYNNIPYVRELLQDRMKVTNESRKLGLGRSAHYKRVHDWYADHGWLRRTKGKDPRYVINVWDAWHAYQKRYEARTGVEDDEYHKIKDTKDKAWTDLEKQARKKLGKLGY